MEYTTVKDILAKLMRNSILLRKFLYSISSIVFLREWYVKRAISRLHTINNNINEILDAGSGLGQYCYYCSRKFPQAEILGIDINERYIDDCKRFAAGTNLEKLHFQKKDLTAMEFKDKFDLVLSVDVLEHIKDDRAFLSRMYRAVKPGGSVIISTPTLYRRHQVDAEFVEEHERDGYSEENIKTQLTDCGFSQIEVTYSYGMWGDFSWRLGIRNSMKFFKSGILGRIFAFIYFPIVFPLVFLFMVLDYFRNNTSGTGFVITARK